ncbi:hypothetical protein BVZ80_00900B, partial [Haemophilus influenzae]
EIKTGSNRRRKRREKCGNKSDCFLKINPKLTALCSRTNRKIHSLCST